VLNVILFNGSCSGLQTAYNSKNSLFRHVRKLLALPFLPAEHIPEAFASITGKFDDVRVRQLESYIEATWMKSSLWKVQDWCIYMQPVRTNNDTEGWHRRLNTRARRGELPFYLLISLLHEEALLVHLSAALVSDHRLCRYQRKSTKSTQARLFHVWTEYRAGTRSTSALLRACSRVYAPNTSDEN
jgi:hypothetical protein